MPLTTLGALVVIGLLVVFVVMYVTNQNVDEAGLTREKALSAIALDFPVFEPKDILIGKDGLTALMTTQRADRIALATMVGSRVATRQLEAMDVSEAVLEGQNLHISLRDITLTAVDLPLDDEEQLAIARRIVETLSPG